MFQTTAIRQCDPINEKEVFSMSAPKPTPDKWGGWQTQVVRGTKGKKLVPLTSNARISKQLRAEEVSTDECNPDRSD